jgi:hypothetical protein
MVIWFGGGQGPQKTTFGANRMNLCFFLVWQTGSMIIRFGVFIGDGV